MGCLMFPFELFFDGAIEGWLCLMQWIVPEKVLNKGVRVVLQILVYIFSAILFIVMFLGLIALFSDDKDLNYLGKFMVFIPLGISFVQVFLGIIVRYITKKK